LSDEKNPCGEESIIAPAHRGFYILMVFCCGIATAEEIQFLISF